MITVRCVATVILLGLLCYGDATAKNIFHDTNGRCDMKTPIQLTEGEEILVRSGSWKFDRQTLDCSLLFQASTEDGICLTFNNFYIHDCSFFLTIYRGIKDDSSEWSEFNCNHTQSGEICVSYPKITLRFLKTRVTQQNGYGFDINVREKTPGTHQGGGFVPFVFVIGSPIKIFIIVVLVVLVILALIFCCFCRNTTPAVVTPFAKSKPNYESHTMPSAMAPWH